MKMSKRRLREVIRWSCMRDRDARIAYRLAIVTAMVQAGELNPDRLNKESGEIVHMLMCEKAKEERRTGGDPAWTDEMKEYFKAEEGESNRRITGDGR